MRSKLYNKIIVMISAVLLFMAAPFDVSATEVASDSERAAQEEVAVEGEEPVYGWMVHDGTYDIEVKSSSSMFKIVACELTVSGDDMTAVMTLSGKGYLKLFMGTGEEAVKADASEYIEYAEDADGAYTYTVPVEALDQKLECTGFSKRKEKWYDHQINFRADTLPDGALLTEDEIKAYEESQNTAKEESTDIALDQGLEEGKEYTVEVSMTGGSGRASITTPTRITVTDGIVMADIEWSSPNYDYMIVDGEKYLPINTEGNSLFVIPVKGFNEPVDVIGDTTAMSEPHEIEYQLCFDAATIQENKDERTLGLAIIIGCIIACAIVILLIILLISRKKRSR